MYYNFNKCDNSYDYENSNNDEFHKNCCVKRVEETFCCFPSYCENKENKKEEKTYPCYEGTFSLYPVKSHCHSKRDDYYSNESKCPKQKRCCFCNLFGRW